MANKDFKVKNNLVVGDLTTAGPIVRHTDGTLTSHTALPITAGGTGQTSQTNALNALLPVQTSALNKFLYSDGTNADWAIPSYSEVAYSGVAQSARKTINFIGALIADDSGNNRTNVTIIGSPLDILDGGSYDSVAPYDGGYYNTASFTYTFDGGTP
jgi:hypothetical protein